jgi:hypothetical protein
MLRAAVRGAHTAFLLVQLRGAGEDRRLFIFLLLTVRFGGKRGDTYEMAGRHVVIPTKWREDSE